MLISPIYSTLSDCSEVVWFLVNNVIFYFVIVAASTYFKFSYIETLLPSLSYFFSMIELFSLFFVMVCNHFFGWKILFSYLHLKFSLFVALYFSRNVVFLNYPYCLIHIFLVWDQLQYYNLLQLKTNLMQCQEIKELIPYILILTFAVTLIYASCWLLSSRKYHNK